MAKVIFKRIANHSNINSIAFTDGQIIYTKDGYVYLDYEDQRITLMYPEMDIDTEISSTSTNAVENQAIKAYVDNKANDVGGKVLWSNNSPTSSFSAQTITLSESLNNYESYSILFFQSNSSSRQMNTGKIPVGSGTILNFNAGNTYFRATGVTVTGNTITFENAYVGSTASNINCIPIKVIGYKTGV